MRIRSKTVTFLLALFAWLIFILLMYLSYFTYKYGNIPEETRFINTDSSLFSNSYLFLLFINFVFFLVLGIGYIRSNNFPNIFIILLISNLLITLSLFGYFYYNIHMQLGNSIIALLIFSMLIISIFRFRKAVISPISK